MINSASEGNYMEILFDALHSFKCAKDLDVQYFLNNKAVDFEIRGLATTYLIFSQEAFNEGIFFIEGYFSLTHKAVCFKHTVSLSSRKKLSGSKNATIDSFVLIAIGVPT